MPWFWLIVGGLFEVGFTTALRYVDGLGTCPGPWCSWAASPQAWACLSLRRGRSRWARPMRCGAESACGDGRGGIAFFGEPRGLVRAHC